MKLAALALSLLTLTPVTQDKIENHINVTGWPHGKFMYTEKNYPVNVQVVGTDLPDTFVMEFQMEDIDGQMVTAMRSIGQRGRIHKMNFSVSQAYVEARRKVVVRKDSFDADYNPFPKEEEFLQDNNRWNGQLKSQIVIRNPNKGDTFIPLHFREYFENWNGKIHTKRLLQVRVSCLQCRV